MGLKKLYAVQVRTGTEARVCKLLKHDMRDVITDCFTPVIETKRATKGVWRTVRERLLPGYVFIETRKPLETFQKLKRIPAFTRLLGTNGDVFTPLTRDEVAWLNIHTDATTHTVAMSTGYIEGDRVVVAKGPLKGHEYEIKKIDRHKRRAWIEFEMCGKTFLKPFGFECMYKTKG